jgi:short-subunit dehydrogenase
MQNRLNGENIWLTGASSGIGKDLLELLLQNGAKVFATSRDLSGLQQLKSQYQSKLELVSADVADIEQVIKCINTIMQHTTKLDRIILNAGVCHYLDLPKFDAKIIKDNFAVNFFGIVNCIEQAWPLLQNASKPHIVGMSSSVAYLALPRAEGYGASKAASLYMLRALQSHLYSVNSQTKQTDVSIICPGFVDTPLTKRNDFPMPFIVESKKAAAIILDGILKRKTEIAFPSRLVWIFKLISFLPDRLRIKLLANLVAKR